MRRARTASLCAIGIALLVLSTSCGVLELGGGEHRAVVVEPAQSDEAERWSLIAELLATEISGTSVIELSFAPGEVACEDGTAIDPSELVLGREFRFEQQGSVLAEDRPQVVGVDLVVACD
ncbi:MAG: hypothetical protein R6U94_08560 [Nitriliruptoraceae bacterium]